jgi:hypothetical protein
MFVFNALPMRACDQPHVFAVLPWKIRLHHVRSRHARLQRVRLQHALPFTQSASTNPCKMQASQAGNPVHILRPFMVWPKAPEVDRMTQRIAWLTVLLGSALIAAPSAQARATTHTSAGTTTHAAHASGTSHATSGNADSASSGNRGASANDDNTDGKHASGNGAACVDNSSTTIVPQATCSHNDDDDSGSGSAGGSGLSWQSLLPGSIQ